MKKSKNLSLFRIATIFAINIFLKSYVLLALSFLYIFLFNKKELALTVGLIFITYLLFYFNLNVINIGVVVENRSNYCIVDSVLFKTKVYDINKDVGTIVKINEKVLNDNSSNLVYNVKYVSNLELLDLNKKSPLFYSYNRLKNLDHDSYIITSKVLFNNYLEDNEIDYYLGVGFCFYYLLIMIYKKNKYISIIFMFIYSLFFSFQIKFFLILINFLCSFINIRKSDILSIKIIAISMLNINLLLNFSILMSLLFDIINIFDFKSKSIILIVQSLLFSNINVFISFFYNWFSILQILIFCIAALLFIFPSFSFFLSFFKFLSIFRFIFNLSIRGKISIFSILIIFIFSKLKLNRKIQSALLITCLLSPLNNPIGHVTFIDVGQGDSTLLKGPFLSYNVLIDTGSKYNYSKLKKYLLSEGIYKIDYLIISHNDSDHNGNINNLKKDFIIDNIIDNPCDIKLKSLYIQNLYLGKFENDNQNSLIHYCEIDEYKFLFTGDIDKHVEQILVKNTDLNNIDVLKVAHHGSNTSSSELFIRNILPRFAIISTSGQYNHPSLSTIQTLSDYKVDIYITKDSGNITFYFTKLIDFIKTSHNDFDIIIT